MAQKIALFNHRAGTGKTTTAFHLGWMLASKGKRVILVDADPQCGLTELALNYDGEAGWERLYENPGGRDLKSALRDPFEARPYPLEAFNCLQVERQEGLFLIPGHIGLSEYDFPLTVAQGLFKWSYALENIPGSIFALIERTAEKYEADYVLIDMNPSLSSVNQNLLMTSDFFIVPASPGYFSLMAIDSFARIVREWRAWSKRASSREVLMEAVYPFPNITPKFLGTVVQNYHSGKGEPRGTFQTSVSKINGAVAENLVPELSKLDMMLPSDCYASQQVDGYCLASVPDINSLITKSWETHTPVFALTARQIGQTGGDLDTAIKSRNRFEEIFSELADKVIGITGYASCN